ncbi:hypothetical protein CJF31_00004918 [Rutstroemia sp. NJR-2017a BVV2]|nr:hypothetical protein CJF31_00004918 [Rutstroemia sp. NJR-2017a BVV2]
MTTDILVLGLGELGTAVLKGLADVLPPSTTLTALIRPSTLNSSSPSTTQKLSFLQSHNITSLTGDIESLSPSSLADLFRPFTIVISCLGYTSSGTKIQEKITRAVLAARVPRFIPWQFGVDYDVIGKGSAQDLFDEQCDVRSLLRNREENPGTEWVIVSTGIFMSFLFEEFWGVVDVKEKKWVVRALGSWENKVTVTTPEDIGRLTARIVFEKPRVKNEVVFVAGDTISYAQLANIVEEITGSEVKRELWDVPSLKQGLAEDKDNSVKKYKVVFAEGRGCSWDMEKTFNFQKSIPVEDVKTWAKRNLLAKRG